MLALIVGAVPVVTMSCETGTAPVEMVLIPAGSFWMGCNEAVDDQCSLDEYPYHEVTLSAYYMDKTEVTLTAYEECVTAGSCTAPSTGGDCIWDTSGKGYHPVNCVDWNQSRTYCEWAGKRLPTEAEWEKAARGTDGRKYPWGNETPTCDYAVIADSTHAEGCGRATTRDVCSKSPAGDSPYGLCDMTGNVWEWVSDWHSYDYYQNGPATNPVGPESGTARIMRGGGYFYQDFSILRTSIRGSNVQSGTLFHLGFRCARSL